jgi:hypothetical protein
MPLWMKTIKVLDILELIMIVALVIWSFASIQQGYVRSLPIWIILGVMIVGRLSDSFLYYKNLPRTEDRRADLARAIRLAHYPYYANTYFREWRMKNLKKQ